MGVDLVASSAVLVTPFRCLCILLDKVGLFWCSRARLRGVAEVVS
jgi:hypothetical protein